MRNLLDLLNLLSSLKSHVQSYQTFVFHTRKIVYSLRTGLTGLYESTTYGFLTSYSGYQICGWLVESGYVSIYSLLTVMGFAERPV